MDRSQQPEHLDLVSLEEVHRLLSHTTFASPEDLSTVAGFDSIEALAAALSPAQPTDAKGVLAGDPTAPALPRRASRLTPRRR